ncbi:MAG: hypothetical protein JWP01_2481 [Myxococcales bacterium]|nr:hypothetical protein [Myxococcales bacterium]
MFLDGNRFLALALSLCVVTGCKDGDDKAGSEAAEAVEAPSPPRAMGQGWTLRQEGTQYVASNDAYSLRLPTKPDVRATATELHVRSKSADGKTEYGFYFAVAPKDRPFDGDRAAEIGITAFGQTFDLMLGPAAEKTKRLGVPARDFNGAYSGGGAMQEIHGTSLADPASKTVLVVFAFRPEKTDPSTTQPFLDSLAAATRRP